VSLTRDAGRAYPRPIKCRKPPGLRMRVMEPQASIQTVGARHPWSVLSFGSWFHRLVLEARGVSRGNADGLRWSGADSLI